MLPRVKALPLYWQLGLTHTDGRQIGTGGIQADLVIL